MSAERTIIEYGGLAEGRLLELLDRISGIRVGFLGDLCIDIYWYADMTRSEISRETPHFPLPIVRETYSPGAGGNVVANLAALRPRAIRAIGVIGRDWRGMLIKECMKDLGVETEDVTEIAGYMSNAYCKPMRKGISDVVYEDPRLDFTGEPLGREQEAMVIASLEQAAREVDIFCVADQFINGCVTGAVREVLCRIGRSMPVVVDSRDRVTSYRNVILKPNEVESARAASQLSAGTEPVVYAKGLEGAAAAGMILREHLQSDVSMTLGKEGNLQIYGDRMVHVPPRDIAGPIDFCGAGDTFLSAYTCALAAGASREEAGQIAGMAAEVTIRKLGQTGTATREEITGRYREAYAVRKAGGTGNGKA